jgi:hypothetical protein
MKTHRMVQKLKQGQAVEAWGFSISLQFLKKGKWHKNSCSTPKVWHLVNNIMHSIKNILFKIVICISDILFMSK